MTFPPVETVNFCPVDKRSTFKKSRYPCTRKVESLPARQ